MNKLNATNLTHWTKLRLVNGNGWIIDPKHVTDELSTYKSDGYMHGVSFNDGELTPDQIDWNGLPDEGFTVVTEDNLDNIRPLDLKREAEIAIEAGKIACFGQGVSADGDMMDILCIDGRYGVSVHLSEASWFDAHSASEAIDKWNDEFSITSNSTFIYELTDIEYDQLVKAELRHNDNTVVTFNGCRYEDKVIEGTVISPKFSLKTEVRCHGKDDLEQTMRRYLV